MLLCLASVYQKEAPSVAAVTQLYCFCKCLNRRCFFTEDFPKISSHHLSCSRRVHDHRTTRLKTHNFPRKSWPFHHLNQLRLVVDPIFFHGFIHPMCCRISAINSRKFGFHLVFNLVCWEHAYCAWKMAPFFDRKIVYVEKDFEIRITFSCCEFEPGIHSSKPT